MNWCPSVRSTWPSAAPHLEIHIPIASQSELLRHFLFLHHSSLSSAVCQSPCVWTNTSPQTCSLPVMCNFDTREGAVNRTMDPCNFLYGNLCAGSGSFFPDGLLLLGGLPFKEIFPSLFVFDFLRRRGTTWTRSTFTEIVPKLQASPSPFTFHWSQSPCFRSALTNFPLLLLFAGVPVTVLSCVASKLRAFVVWSRNFFTMVFSLW